MRILPAIFLLLATVGCNNPQIVGEGDPFDFPTDEVQTWPQAIRLTNGDVTVVVVPTIGRVMRFAHADGKNVLWVNPDELNATTSPAWKNWGGDKAWPWPQSHWSLYTGRVWPPPQECDQVPMKGRMTGTLGMRLESNEIRGYAARLVRDITLDSEGARVQMVTRFERSGAELAPPELSAWQVTQLEPGEKMFARLLPSPRVTGLAPHAAWTTTRPVSGQVVLLVPPDGKRDVKMGLDADVLALVRGELLFVARSQTASAPSSGFTPGERAQVFIPATKAGEKGPRYVEFEFTSPRKDLAQNQVPELRTTWELFRAQEGKAWTDADVAAILRL